MVALVLALGCADEGLDRLTEKDVTGLPAGNAVGTTFSGIYRPISVHVDGCRCRTAFTCDELASTAPGDMFSVVQRDGSLMIGSAPACTGGVSAQGRFRCGAAAQGADGAPSYMLINGWFGLRSGLPESMQSVWELTSYVANGLVMEWQCDMRLSQIAVFVGP